MGGAILYSMCTMRALQVDRLQRRKDLATAETGEDREAPGRRMQRSQLRLAPPNGNPSYVPSYVICNSYSCFKCCKLGPLSTLMNLDRIMEGTIFFSSAVHSGQVSTYARNYAPINIMPIWEAR